MVDKPLEGISSLDSDIWEPEEVERAGVSREDTPFV